jgi:hypothetical protein
LGRQANDEKIVMQILEEREYRLTAKKLLVLTPANPTMLKTQKYESKW